MNVMKTTLCLMLFVFSLLSCNSTTTNNDEGNLPICDSVCDTLTNILAETETQNHELINKQNCFIVISKPKLCLSVYEVVGSDTVLIKSYPVCVGKNYGQKQKKGDMRTPECSMVNSFTISEIKNASNWYHDFGDGRGEILAYGNWFMRLVTPGFSGIGIHGSTNNENSVPGRGSEGCIRLRNDDLDELKEKYAFVGMKVIITPDIIPQPQENTAQKPQQPTIETDSTNHPSFVYVAGERQRLRLGPNKDTDPIYKDENGKDIFPNNGQKLECLGEFGNYYKVLFDGKELYINKVSCQK